jgi:hypothetical protein
MCITAPCICAEEFIHGLDEATGASLKFTVLNPKGRVWLMVAGGGASVIYTDTVADLGYAQVGERGHSRTADEGCRRGLPRNQHGLIRPVADAVADHQTLMPVLQCLCWRCLPGVQELGNYGEYSGAPNTQVSHAPSHLMSSDVAQASFLPPPGTGRSQPRHSVCPGLFLTLMAPPLPHPPCRRPTSTPGLSSTVPPPTWTTGAGPCSLVEASPTSRMWQPHSR